MRQVVYEDKNGFLRRVLLRDEDGDDMAEYGVPCGPPDVDLVDWESLKRDINNYLVRNGIVTHIDLQSKRALDPLSNLFKRYIDHVFREKATEDKSKRKQ